MQTQFGHLGHTAAKMIKAVFPSTKKQWMYLTSFLVVFLGVSLWFGSDVHAEEAGTAESIATWIMILISKAILVIAKICISLTVFALEFFVKLAKYNGYVDAPIVIVGWTMVRDIANMFFVVVLLVIAFGTILGLEQYEWKKTMVNFILAAILINFSKLIAGVIIDVAHVFTMTFTNAIAATAGGNLINMFHLDKIVSIASGGITNEAGADIILEVFGGVVMALVFAVLAMFTMGAYLIVMLARLVVLWVLIILSPLAYILGTMPQTKSYADTWWSEFGKHVAVAPVMVFFLWLGFATLGSGSFVQSDLDINFATEQNETSKALNISSAQLANPKVSISEVSSWENMANFVIAIAFLWIGIEQVQKMGVRGGEALSTAKSFATKAALIGSGYALGRWMVGEAYDKGKIGAGYVGKETFKRVPLVGGAALQEYGTAIKSTYERKGVLGVAGAAAAGVTGGAIGASWQGLGGMESKIQRSEYAKGEEGKGPAGWLKARIMEPAERAEKRAEDWKNASERMSKTLEESYSTSSSRAGQAKLDATVRMQSTLQMAEAKGKQKMEGRTKESLDILKIFDEMGDAKGKAKTALNADASYLALSDDDKKKAMKAKVESIEKDLQKDSTFMAQVEDQYIKTVIPKDDQNKVRKFIKRDGGIQSRLTLAQDVRAKKKTKAGSLAEAEEAARALNRAGEVREARARDDLLIGGGQSPRYVEAVLAKHQKEDIELISNSNYDRTKQKGVQLGEAIDKARRDGKPDEENRRIREMLTLQAANGLRGHTFSVDARDASVQGINTDDYKAEESADAIVAQQARELSSVFHEKVEANAASVNDALKRLRDVVYKDDNDGYVAAMRAFTDGLSNSASDGAVNKAGLFREKFDAATGKTVFNAVDWNNADDQDWSKDKRIYALSQCKPGKLEGFHGSLDRKDGKYVIESDTAIQRVADMWGNITTNVISSVDKQNIDTFDYAFEEMYKKDAAVAQTNIQKMIDKMREKAADERGIVALLRRTKLATLFPANTFNVAGKAGQPPVNI